MDSHPSAKARGLSSLNAHQSQIPSSSFYPITGRRPPDLVPQMDLASCRNDTNEYTPIFHLHTDLEIVVDNFFFASNYLPEPTHHRYKHHRKSLHLRRYSITS
jgi:hypothetical protein